MRIRLSVVTAIVAAGLATVATAGTTSLPELTPFPGNPTKLKPGGYRTGEGFSPITTFRVGMGWYGNMPVATKSAKWFSIGKGLDRFEERFTYAGMYVDTLTLPYAKAVAKFRGLKTLVAGAGTPTRIGGYAGVTFRAKVKGDHAPLIALGTGADIPRDVAGQQTFVNVRGTTLLIRTELGKARAAPAEVQAVLRSFRFPR